MSELVRCSQLDNTSDRDFETDTKVPSELKNPALPLTISVCGKRLVGNAFDLSSISIINFSSRYIYWTRHVPPFFLSVKT